MPFERNSPARCFMTPPPPRLSSWRSTPSRSPIMMPLSERKRSSPNKDDPYHVIHKVPAGDSPYVKAKQVQLVDKDPGKAISLFWAAINAGDRVESALKDMALVMKQLNRSDEAIEAIKSFRHLCPPDSQESLDNILVELYKRSGRVDEEISMLHHKLKQIEDGVTFVGRTTKQARSQGKKIHVTAEQEISRILGNLAWAYLQKGDYKAAEEHYRKALSFEVDRNKQCNLAICLMQTNRITEAKFLLQAVTTASKHRKMDDSCAKSFERASQMLMDMESSSSQCSPLSNLSGKSSDMVQSRTQNWSVTSEGEVSNARRRLYESPEPARRDLKVPYTNTKKCSWGFNNGPQRETWGDVHSDPKPSFGIPSTQNNLSLPANGKWNARTMVKREDKTAIGSGLYTYSNTETDRKFKEDKFAVESNDMVVNGANQFASSIGTDQRSIKPVEKKSWADIVEEEQNEGHDFFGGYTRFDGQEGAQVFNKENENSNIVFQRPWPLSETKCISKKLESMDLKDGHHGSGTVILSRKPAVRRSLCFNPELAKERDSSLSEEKKPPRNNRLQVFKDIALHPETP
ncbi:protein POLLENLESS 3 [Lotus japonicus]|uniref:protein POLLENLESS 3 n=1 Tax=Lotus japonicus TaxID=34305 RepID=UPI002589D07E|nr:protein POLLENLESS 3 [Lotus japonicus]